jgi:hypothetical protein
MIEISKGVYVIDVDKFKEVYEARKDSVNVLSVGVKERMELYKFKKVINALALPKYQD